MHFYRSSFGLAEGNGLGRSALNSPHFLIQNERYSKTFLTILFLSYKKTDHPTQLWNGLFN